jgi:hypothetical protein
LLPVTVQGTLSPVTVDDSPLSLCSPFCPPQQNKLLVPSHLLKFFSFFITTYLMLWLKLEVTGKNKHLRTTLKLPCKAHQGLQFEPDGATYPMLQCGINHTQNSKMAGI